MMQIDHSINVKKVLAEIAKIIAENKQLKFQLENISKLYKEDMLFTFCDECKMFYPSNTIFCNNALCGFVNKELQEVSLSYNDILEVLNKTKGVEKLVF